MNRNRRQFLRDSIGVAAALAAAPVAARLTAAEPAAKKAAANDQLRVAVVGVKGRGMQHIEAFSKPSSGCFITTVCDADEAVIGPAMKKSEEQQQKAPRFEKDIRKVLEDKNVDVIAIATPNHWHALMAVWALQAGKDVYVEKPVSHNVWEGRQIVEAARKYDKICQTGTQSRSSTGMREAMAFLHAGKLGKISVAQGTCYKSRKSIGKVEGEQPIPKTCDYDLWCGPAPKKPLMRQKLHYDWHWVWDYGNGDLGNQGIHEMDKARWGLNKMELPKAVFSLGGRFGYIDDGETANTQVCFFDYGDCQLIFEVRGLPSNSPHKNFAGKPGENFVGNIFYGADGYLICPSYTGGTAFTKDGEVIKTFKGPDDHFGNFVKAVRSRKKEDLNADILEGHLSSALCHLGNISYRSGNLVPADKLAAAVGVNKATQESVNRMVEHLKENKVDIHATPCRVGKTLAIDPKTETFVSDKEANEMLTRPYRKGFEVPQKV